MKRLNKIINILKEKELSLSLAESCSGGYACYLMTEIPGSSKVFKGGMILYSLESKNKLLKIPWALLKKTQGVSAKVAGLLARKIRKKFNSDIGAALVGFAGPKSKNKVPVGTVFLSVNYKNKTETKKIILKGPRNKIQKEASYLLLELINDKIK